MPEKQKVTRKLRAIFSADVKGYSILMADDEISTIQTLKNYRNIMSVSIEQHQGRVVDAVGDNLLAEFDSAVDAVECAVEIQKKLKDKNEGLLKTKRLQFRIGINIGDVVQDGDRIYGSGVNIAARIEGLADPGGICISRNVYNHIRDKLGFGYEYLGEHSVKNIKHPVRVYKVLTDSKNAGKLIGEKPKLADKKWILPVLIVASIMVASIAWYLLQDFVKPDVEPASVERMAYSLPDRPSLAVLPFNNLSGDPDQEYFSDGLTEQIISTLSKIRSLFVIARNSTFIYKGTPVKIQKVAEDLGVKYVLEGSVQKSADRIRITVQLIDATTGHHIWSERYDREQKDIFEIQDDITMEITKALGIELIEGEQARIWQERQTSNLKAYEKYLQGRRYFWELTKEKNTRARKLYTEAIALDPGYALAYAGLGMTHFNDARYGWAEFRAESIKMAEKNAQKAVEIDNSLDKAYALRGLIYLLKRQYEESLAQMERAITLNPNSAQNNSIMAGSLGLAGRWEEGIAYSKKSIRLAPIPEALYFWILGRAYFMTAKYNEAVEAFKKAVHVNPDYLIAHAFLAASYSSLGRPKEAAIEADEVLRVNPKFTLKSYAKTLPYKNKSDIERYISALRKAGLPDKPPLPLPDKPSIAVLPFVNMSADPEQEYFSDGMTDELIGDLAKINGILVISRNSAFTYKGKIVRAPQIAKELNVRYILEGSVQRSGNSVRIRAQLIDGKTDHHLWSGSYDGLMDDIFELQDRITNKIVSELSVKLTHDEQNRISEKDTENILAYDAYLKGFEHFSRMTGENLLNAIKYFRQAVEIDPTFNRAYSGLAAAYFMITAFDFPKVMEVTNVSDFGIFRYKARHYLNLAMKNPTWEAYRVAAYMSMNRKQFDEAVSFSMKAVLMAPNEYLANIAMGRVLNSVGRADEALKFLDKAMRLDPRFLDILLVEKGKAFFLLGDFKKAIECIQRGLTLNPALTNYSSFEAASYAFLGKEMEAQNAWIKFTDGFPFGSFLTTEFLYYFFSFKDHKAFDRFIDGLKKAGFEGNSLDYNKVEMKNKLTGQEIRELLFGKIATGKNIWGREFFYKWTSTGDFELSIPSLGMFERGKSSIDQDSVCIQYEYLYEGLRLCFDCYYNTEGNDVDKNQYLLIGDAWINSFSIKNKDGS